MHMMKGADEVVRPMACNYLFDKRFVADVELRLKTNQNFNLVSILFFECPSSQLKKKLHVTTDIIQPFFLWPGFKFVHVDLHVTTFFFD